MATTSSRPWRCIVIAIAGYELWQRYEAEPARSRPPTPSSPRSSLPTPAIRPGRRRVRRSSPRRARRLRRAGAAGAGRRAARRRPARRGDRRSTSRSPTTTTARSATSRASAPPGRWPTAPRNPICETLLAPLTDPTAPWRFMAREMLAYADYHAGNIAQGADRIRRRWPTTPTRRDTLRQRAAAMAAFLKAGGDKNFGTVPPPPPAADARHAAQSGKAPHTMK